jgi:hypothetical protein
MKELVPDQTRTVTGGTPATLPPRLYPDPVLPSEQPGASVDDHAPREPPQ